MKAWLFSAALIGGVVVTSACLAAERSAKPAPATDGHAVVNPTDHPDSHQTPAPSGSESSVRTPPDTAGEEPRGDGQDKSAAKTPKPDAETPRAGPTHAHGPHRSTGQSRGDDKAKPSNPIDTRITVNQGRMPENSRKGSIRMPGPLSEKAKRSNVQKGVRVPHSVTRSRAVHGPTRNAVGVTPAPNAVAPGVGAAAFPRIEGARSPVGTRSTLAPAIRPQGGAPPMGGAGSGTAAAVGSRVGPAMPGSASINGTGMARGALRLGEIGGPAKNNAGINGSSVRPKRP
jgi:hypothetical protein